MDGLSAQSLEDIRYSIGCFLEGKDLCNLRLVSTSFCKVILNFPFWEIKAKTLLLKKIENLRYQEFVLNTLKKCISIAYTALPFSSPKGKNIFEIEEMIRLEIARKQSEKLSLFPRLDYLTDYNSSLETDKPHAALALFWDNNKKLSTADDFIDDSITSLDSTYNCKMKEENIEAYLKISTCKQPDFFYKIFYAACNLVSASLFSSSLDLGLQDCLEKLGLDISKKVFKELLFCHSHLKDEQTCDFLKILIEKKIPISQAVVNLLVDYGLLQTAQLAVSNQKDLVIQTLSAMQKFFLLKQGLLYAIHCQNQISDENIDRLFYFPDIDVELLRKVLEYRNDYPINPYQACIYAIKFRSCALLSYWIKHFNRKYGNQFAETILKSTIDIEWKIEALSLLVKKGLSPTHETIGLALKTNSIQLIKILTGDPSRGFIKLKSTLLLITIFTPDSRRITLTNRHLDDALTSNLDENIIFHLLDYKVPVDESNCSSLFRWKRSEKLVLRFLNLCGSSLDNQGLLQADFWKYSDEILLSRVRF